MKGGSRTTFESVRGGLLGFEWNHLYYEQFVYGQTTKRQKEASFGQ